MFKYQIIAKDIQKKIEQGEFSPGEQLPQEIEMCKHYNASRITIREAMNQLVLLGLIIKRRGSGTFVKNVAEDMQNRRMLFLNLHNLTVLLEIVLNLKFLLIFIIFQ